MNARIGGLLVIHTAGVSKAILAFTDDGRREATSG